MSFSAPTMMLAAAGVKAFGSVMQGESQARSEEFNSAIATQNAAIARQQGVAAVQAQQRDAARKIGSMVASYGASGVQTDSGSPVDVLADSAAMATLDRLTLKYNYELKGAGFENQAAMDNMSAKSARTAGVLNALSGATDSYGKYQSMKGTPIPNLGSSSGSSSSFGWDMG